MVCLIEIINLIKNILIMKLTNINQRSKLLINILIFKIIIKLVKYDNLLIRSKIINKYEEQKYKNDINRKNG